MATAAVSTNSIYQQLQSYWQQRSTDLNGLGQALQSGDLATAQQEYQAIETLGQSGPFANGEPFKQTQREQDFEAIGTALQSGDLAGAQQAFAQLQSTFHHHHDTSAAADSVDLSSAASSAASASSASSSSAASSSASASSTSAASGPEIVLNLGNMPAGEQITIGLSNGQSGSEQVTISTADAQGQSAGQITLNLAQNSNEQIILNLFNSSTSSSSQSSGLSVTA